ncbi:MAG: mechanosensitive ion channel protein MscS [Phycisphaerae bacterium]|nr:mechanosensitive ion channel protein MscS [Phycisphaerae bacterium]
MRRVMHIVGLALAAFIGIASAAAPTPPDVEPTPRSDAAETADADQPAETVERQDAARQSLEAVRGLTDAEVEIKGSTAVLTGTANDPAVAERAEEIVRSTTGAASIDNRIELTNNVGERIEGATDRVGDTFDRWIAYLPLLPIAGAVLAIFVVLAWAVGLWRWPFRRFAANEFLSDIARRMTQAAIVLVGLLLALEILNAMALVGGVLGAAGVAGIAIGFAFRDLVENYIASILLSIRQPFRPRDHVVIDGHEGLVTAMNSRTTVLTTFDGNVVRIPNATVFKTTLVNYSTDSRRRFSFEVGVGYDVDLATALEVGVETLRATDGVMADPAPFAIVTKLGDSSITVQLFAWVDQSKSDFGKVRSVAMQRVKSEFDTRDIDMPEPIYTVKLARPSRESAAGGPAAEPASSPASEPTQDVARDDTAETFADLAEGASGANLLDDDAKLE